MTHFLRHPSGMKWCAEHRLLRFALESGSRDAPKETAKQPEAKNAPTDPKSAFRDRVGKADADVQRANKTVNGGVKNTEQKTDGQGTSKEEKKKEKGPLQEREDAAQKEYAYLNKSFKNRLQGIEGNIAQSKKTIASQGFFESFGSNEKSSMKQDESYRSQL